MEYQSCGKVWKTLRQEMSKAGREAACRAFPRTQAGVPPALRACSACAGDYEDPDRTAWSEEELNRGVDEEEREALEDGFPVPEVQEE